MMIEPYKIVLVGNGPSLLGRGLGPQIDKFDCVVRFNNFQLEGYESDVGTKTNVLARRSCDDVKWHDHSLFDKVFNFITYCRWTVGMVTVSRKVKNFYGDKCVNVGLETCKRIGEEIGLDQPANEWASIGVLAVGKYVEGGVPIHICGFDHLTKNDNGIVDHYFPKAPKDAKYHNGEKERSYINKLIKDGSVVRL